MKALLIACFMVLFLVAPAHARPARAACRFGPEWTERAVKRTIWCAENRWAVPGGVRMALCIARRESGLYARAANPYSSALGIFQIVQGTWDSWFRGMPDMRRWFVVGYDRTNARNNVMIAVRKMSHEGLAPWGGGCS